MVKNVRETVIAVKQIMPIREDTTALITPPMITPAMMEPMAQ
jgi:hypothetical protein